MNVHLEGIIHAFKTGNWCVLDTETTGLDHAEVCQIAVINPHGGIELDTLVCTKYPIPPDATHIHGITNDMVRDAPTWPLLLPEITRLLTGTNVIVYNALYDRKIMHQTGERWGLPKTDWKALSDWHCAMEAFAPIYGDWNHYRQSYRWQKLATAAQYYGAPVEGAHSALGDCRMTLSVTLAMIADGISGQLAGANSPQDAI